MVSGRFVSPLRSACPCSLCVLSVPFSSTPLPPSSPPCLPFSEGLVQSERKGDLPRALRMSWERGLAARACRHYGNRSLAAGPPGC